MVQESRLKAVMPEYLVYVGLFVGTGFLSGAIVHFPLNPIRFAVIGTVGAAIFVASSVINETVLNKKPTGQTDIVRLIIFSLVLALGIGMISGGVQHFDEVPAYASKLIPLGVLLSLVGYLLKNGISLAGRQRFKLGIATFAFVAMLGTTLNVYAQSRPQEGHGHGEEAGHTTPVPASDSETYETSETYDTSTSTPSHTPPVGDGHGEAGHH